MYKKSDLVEYYSNSHKDWLPATIINVDYEGRIIIDLKPNTWISRDEQATRVRLRKTPAGLNGRPGSRCASPMIRARQLQDLMVFVGIHPVANHHLGVRRAESRQVAQRA